METEYCKCWVPMRTMVDCKGMKCGLCTKPITVQTYELYERITNGSIREE